MGNALSVAILIAVVIVIVVVVAILLLRTTPNPVTNTPTTNPGTLSQPCGFSATNTVPNVFGSTGLCNPGFICEANGVCVSDLGTSCNTLTDCSSQATVCSGRCSNGPTGGLNQLCPCTGLTKCVPQANGYNVCKGLSGSPCLQTTDCIGLCINGFCSGGLPEGSPCISQICSSGLYCDGFGFCQPNGIVTGEQNAFCVITGAPACDPGLRCVDNLCASTFGVLGSNCATQFCNDPLVCTVIPALPGSPTDINSCLFADNNVCVHTCPGNFICTTVGTIKQCLGTTGQACIANSNCSNNTCSNMNGLLQWTGTTWLNVSTPPTDTFSKMLLGTGVTGMQSNVYLLGTTGLWLYNGTWTLLYSLNTTAGKILDFSIMTGVTDTLYLLVLNSSGKTVVLNSNLTPTNKFGTVDGSLVVGSVTIVIASFSVNNLGDIYSNTSGGNVYKNTTFLGNFGTKIRAYEATNPSSNDFTVINNLGVQSFGELGNNFFPLFTQPAIGGLTYNVIANYDISLQYIDLCGVTGSTGASGTTGCTGSSSHVFIPNTSASNLIMIASPNGVNYQIILNTGNLQTTYPGYVNSSTLIAVNTVDKYLYTPRICG